MLEENISPEGAVGGGCGDFCWGNIHALEVVPGSAVGLHSFGQSIHEVFHANTSKCLPASDAHPKEVHLQKPEASVALTVPSCTVGLDALDEALMRCGSQVSAGVERPRGTLYLHTKAVFMTGTSALHTGLCLTGHNWRNGMWQGVCCSFLTKRM